MPTTLLHDFSVTLKGAGAGVDLYSMSWAAVRRDHLCCDKLIL